MKFLERQTVGQEDSKICFDILQKKMLTRLHDNFPIKH